MVRVVRTVVEVAVSFGVLLITIFAGDSRAARDYADLPFAFNQER